MTEGHEYKTKYSEFLELKRSGGVTDKDAGGLIAEMAQYFSEYNLKLAYTQIAYDKLYSSNIQSNDPENGKAISAAKAEVLTRASIEGEQLVVAKAHLQNLEQMINALKSFQRSLGNEYSHQSLS